MNRRRSPKNKFSAKASDHSNDAIAASFKQQNVIALTIEEHKKHFVASLKNLLNEPFANAMTVIVIAIALTLPACLYLIVQNGSELTSRWQTSHDISAYIDNVMDSAALSQFGKRIQAREDVESVRTISAEEALAELGKNSELELLSEALPENPLPHTLVITPSQSDPAELKSLIHDLQNESQIKTVEFDSSWVIKLKNIMSFLSRLVWFLAILLALGVLLIVANTIRLHVNSRRNEIEVKKLIGASDRFVRRPFLYTGFWYGLLGACLAWILVISLQILSKGPLQKLLDAYASTHELSSFGFSESLFLLGTGSFLALFGAWIAAESSIRKIEPQ